MSSCVYAQRRQALFSQMANNSIAVLGASPLLFRNSDTTFAYRQDSYFYYLTGFEESDSIALLIKQQEKCQFVLFCQPSDPLTEQWTGAVAGMLGAREVFGADAAYPFSSCEAQLPDFLMGIQILYYLVNHHPILEKKIFSAVQQLQAKSREKAVFPNEYRDLAVLLNAARVIKTSEELVLLRQSCEISAAAHMQAMRACRVGIFEYELEALLLHEFYRKGSRYPAYASIVAAGNNACTLHYTANNAKIQNNDLVLIDAGSEFQYYAADITRTFPANGKFTAPQQAIYELVLAAQMAAIAQITPGLSWGKAQETILWTLVQGLIDLKLLQGDVASLIAEKAYLPFYMHNSGHWLGMDVHDVGDYKKDGEWQVLKPGMVFTVEPGLYISANNTAVAEKWRGIGVRIEDDVIVTDLGYEVLTQSAVKTPEAIEALMKSGSHVAV